jgi:nicotinamidase-related amidase
MSIDITPHTALVVVDVQQAFEDLGFWGRRNNPAADGHIAALLDAWQSAGRPVVLVRHDSVQPDSPLRPGLPGNGFKGYVEERRGSGTGPELLVTKTVNSAFYGTPDLDAWCKEAGISRLVVVGIQTNMCVETTVRMAGNLGYEVLLPLDATYTFDLTGPFGWHRSADELAGATAVTLHGGGFATVTTAGEVLAAGV